MHSIQVAVTMRRVPNTGASARWESHRWELAHVTPLGQRGSPNVDKGRGSEASTGDAPRAVLQDVDGLVEHWRYAPFDVTLFKDDAQGYRLNVDSPAPCWFVMWRMEVGGENPDEQPDVQAVSLSYHDAGRWLDSQERVDQVPLLPQYPQIVETMVEFADLHEVREEKRRKRPDSFKPLRDRFGMPARVSHG